jgi:phage tail tape-measure protein
MKIRKWTGIFLGLSLLMTMPVFASDDLEALIKAGDHRKLKMHYAEEAKTLKAKADKWEVLAEYYEKFPDEYSGGSENVHMHIENVRAMADDYRKAMHEARDLALRHHSLIRKGP